MDRISVSVQENTYFPKLCWLLEFSIDTGSVKISVGNKVERLEGAIVEGCWDGKFDVHDLESKNLFGSAVKWSKDRLLILGSVSLTDRICYAHEKNKITVSNSLFAVIAAIDAELDDKVNYYKVSYAPLAGIDSYDSNIPVLHDKINSVHQLFHRNFEISPSGKIQVWCKTKAEFFSCYKEYERRLSNAVSELVRNIQSKERKFSVKSYATLSSGYDSTAVAALARDAGVSQALLCSKSRSRIFDIFGDRFTDDGTEAAMALELDVELVNVQNFSIEQDEFLYIAPAASTPETSFMPMLKKLENTSHLSAVFNGHYGDKIWDKNVSKKYVNDQLIRGDMAGINLSEARLKTGCFNVAVPFIFARSSESIVAIGRSTEMSQWSVGGNYDRPIPRRLAEERGVLRKSFGIKKKAIIDRYPEPKNKTLVADYRQYYKKKFGFSVLGYTWAKWRDIWLSVVGRRYNAIQAQRRSKFDCSYWLWFWSATRCNQMYRSLIRRNSKVSAL